MRKLFTLLALLTCFLGAKAAEIVDAEVDFSKVTEIPRFSWGGSESAFSRLSLQDGCLHFHSTEATDPSWDCQFFPIGNVDAEVGVTYTLHFKVKGSVAQGVSMLGFGQTPYGQFQITTDWVEGTVEYQCTENNGNILMQCGDYIGDWDIAYLKITHEGKVERPAEWVELLTNGDAETPWADSEVKYNDTENNYKVCFWTKEKGVNVNENGGSDPHPAEIVELPEGGHAFICRATLADTPDDADGNAVSSWDNQIWLQSPRSWKGGEQYKLSFRYKASQAVKTNTQYHKQNPSDYLWYEGIGDIDFTTEWQTFEQVVTVPSNASGAWSVAFNLNPNVKEPMDFYIDDISWSQMKLDNGLFITATNTVSGLVDYDYDNAVEFVNNEDVQAMEAIVGTAGKPDTWVNEVMISTVRGNDRQYKANTIKAKGSLAPNTIKQEVEDWTFSDYESSSTAKIKLPAAGVWKIYIDTANGQIAAVQVEGDKPKEQVNVVANETEVIVAAVERDWLVAKEDGSAQEDEIGDGQPWDNQFCIMANRTLESDEVTVISFDYMADADAKTNTQCGGSNPGAYVHYAAIGDVDFTSEWQHFEQTFTIPKEANGMQSITFNMAVLKAANNYHIKNIIWKLEDNTETLIEMQGTKNLFVKEGAGTTPYEFGTDPTAVDVVVKENAAPKAVFNIAGQRVSDNYKGIVIMNGVKVVK